MCKCFVDNVIQPFENRQGWRRLKRGAEIEPTSSLVWADVIRVDFQTVISHYLPNIIIYLFCAAQRLLRTIFMQKSKPKYACLPSKIVEVWIERFCVRNDWWRRLQRHQCPQCALYSCLGEVGYGSKLQGQCLVNKCKYHNCLSKLYVSKDDLNE